jgi:hypothetical protein
MVLSGGKRFFPEGSTTGTGVENKGRERSGMKVAAAAGTADGERPAR